MTLRLFFYRLASNRPWPLVAGALLSLISSCFALVPGIVFREYFNVLQGKSRLTLGIEGLAAVIILTAFIRQIVNLVNIYVGTTVGNAIRSLLRRNGFEKYLVEGHRQGISEASGVMINRLHDDVENVVAALEFLINLCSQLVFAGIALTIMVRIDPFICSVVFIPLILLMLSSQMTLKHYVRFRNASREAIGRVSGALPEIFGSVQAIKVAGAERGVIDHLSALNNVRAKASLKENLFGSLVSSVFNNATSLATAAILFLTGASLRNGHFSLGDFSLFLYFLSFVTSIIATSGNVSIVVKQAQVSLDRLQAISSSGDALWLVDPPNEFRDEMAVASDMPAAPLQILTLSGLTYQYDSDQFMIADASFTVLSGSFTVITGRTGAGKTTLLRMILGLITMQSGEILWNDQIIVNPSEFFHPPRSAYTPQSAAIFSDTLLENILLGWPTGEQALNEAIFSAVMENDVAEMPQGLDTLVGPRGVRLSGGQLCRAAAARMFIREAELFVFDDLSAALDVETERLLWDRMFERRKTCLIVSHRPAALARADKIILVKDGVIQAQGTLTELLAASEEKALLWSEALRDQNANP